MTSGLFSSFSVVRITDYSCVLVKQISGMAEIPGAHVLRIYNKLILLFPCVLRVHCMSEWL